MFIFGGKAFCLHGCDLKSWKLLGLRGGGLTFRWGIANPNLSNQKRIYKPSFPKENIKGIDECSLETVDSTCLQQKRPLLFCFLHVTKNKLDSRVKKNRNYLKLVFWTYLKKSFYQKKRKKVQNCSCLPIINAD